MTGRLFLSEPYPVSRWLDNGSPLAQNGSGIEVLKGIEIEIDAARRVYVVTISRAHSFHEEGERQGRALQPDSLT